MSRRSTSSGRLRVSSRNATHGRRSSRYVRHPCSLQRYMPPYCAHGGRAIANHDVLTLIVARLQEAQEKYRASKAELDELVSTMEGL